MIQTVYIGSQTHPYFGQSQIKEIALKLNSTISGDALAYDQFTMDYWSEVNLHGLIYKPTDADGYKDTDGKVYAVQPPFYPDDLPPETPVWYYIDGTLFGKYFVTNATRENEKEFSLTAVSPIGILNNQIHAGNLYTGQTFQEVVTEILGGAFPFTCADNVAGLAIFGWLPEDTRRENLHQLLFATGVQVRKDANGDMYFTFPDTETITTIDPDKIYIDGDKVRTERYAAVRLTEHTFIPSNADITYTLFDNTNGEAVAEHQRISFQYAPCHDLVASGLTIEESGVNYAVVSGTGVLTGKAYSHIRRVEEMQTGQTGNKVKVFDSQTLVSVANSRNAIRRLASYFSSPYIIDESFQVDGEKAGDLVNVTSPYKEVLQAYITEMNISALATAKADAKFLVGYAPTYVGNNFSRSTVITSTSTAFIAKENEYEVCVTLISGGTGGQGGYDGQNGTYGSKDGNGEAGAGGLGGLGGHGGKVLTRIVPVQPRGIYLPDQIGSGGRFGTRGGNAGSDGTPSRMFDLSSADGEIAPSGFMDIFTGIIYAESGTAGADGGAGGAIDGVTGVGQDGGTVVGSILTYHGGQGSPQAENDFGKADGGGGGGAAYGNDGGDATVGTGGTRFTPAEGGSGGDGADARTPEGDTTRGRGGNGGNGAGGGGAGGGAVWLRGWASPSTGGQGGKGSQGLNGSAGVIIVYA